MTPCYSYLAYYMLLWSSTNFTSSIYAVHNIWQGLFQKKPAPVGGRQHIISREGTPCLSFYQEVYVHIFTPTFFIAWENFQTRWLSYVPRFPGEMKMQLPSTWRCRYFLEQPKSEIVKKYRLQGQLNQIRYIDRCIQTFIGIEIFDCNASR